MIAQVARISAAEFDPDFVVALCFSLAGLLLSFAFINATGFSYDPSVWTM